MKCVVHCSPSAGEGELSVVLCMVVSMYSIFVLGVVVLLGIVLLFVALAAESVCHKYPPSPFAYYGCWRDVNNDHARVFILCLTPKHTPARRVCDLNRDGCMLYTAVQTSKRTNPQACVVCVFGFRRHSRRRSLSSVNLVRMILFRRVGWMSFHHTLLYK